MVATPRTKCKPLLSTTVKETGPISGHPNPFIRWPECSVGHPTGERMFASPALQVASRGLLAESVVDDDEPHLLDSPAVR
jgi:hypothetical protein